MSEVCPRERGSNGGALADASPFSDAVQVASSSWQVRLFGADGSVMGRGLVPQRMGIWVASAASRLRNPWPARGGCVLLG
jgi:hypothetical protein